MTNPLIETDDLQRDQWLSYVATLRDRDGLSPFDQQWATFRRLYADRAAALGPPPAWVPGAAEHGQSNLARFMQRLAIASYDELYRWSVDRREDFWQAVLGTLGIVMAKPPDAVLDLSGGAERPRWLPGALLNIVDSCFAAEGTHTAVISGVEGSSELRRTSYDKLQAAVNRCANAFVERGYGPGDGVALYMPMTLECVIAYLGAIRAGCHVVSVADSFPAPELARRLAIGGARLVVSVDLFIRGGKPLELYERVREASELPAVIIPHDPTKAPELRRNDWLWPDFLSASTATTPAVFAPDRLANVLFSSGTTGTPKAIPWTHLTPVKCAMDGHFHQDIRPGEVVAWPTNIGWMMGPWLIFAALVNRATIALFEGSPGSADFARFVEGAGVSILGVVPSLVRAWRAGDATDGVDWRGIRVLSSTGEPSSREDYLWLMSLTGYRAPVIEYCGGTEIGGGYLTGTVLQAASPATFSSPALGLAVRVLDEEQAEVTEGGSGELFLVPPSIGLSRELLNADHHDVYYAGCPKGPAGELLRRHGDRVQRLGRGYLRAQGRADDTMNLGGIKVSSHEIEDAIEQHPAIHESAAVAVTSGGEGADRLVLFLVLGDQAPGPPTVPELQQLISRQLNPLFRISDVVVVDRLPRTPSNKLMRRRLRDHYAPGG